MSKIHATVISMPDVGHNGLALIELTSHHREQAARLLGLLEGIALHPDSNVSDVLTSYRYTYELITSPIPLRDGGPR